jgi:hypothetical protein
MDKNETPDPLDDAARSEAARLLRERAIYPNLTFSPDLTPDTTDWNIVFAGEAELLNQISEAALRRRAPLVYERYMDVVGAEKAARRAANALDVKTCTFDELRADLLQVHSETARHTLTGFQIERERTRLAGIVIVVGVIALIAFVMFIGWVFLKREVGPAAGVAVNTTAVLMIGFGVYAFRKYRVHRRAAVLATVMLIVTAAAGGLITSKTASPQNTALSDLPIVPMVILAGILGASFSILQRVQRSTAADPLVALFNLRAARPQVYLSIISGAIAALVVFAVFGGGMLEGVLFPKIVNWKSDGRGEKMMELSDYLQNTGPLTHFDYAKLLVWAFIAGFAERFVPDILDRFTAGAKKA